jgi:hypothetical protein
MSPDPKDLPAGVADVIGAVTALRDTYRRRAGWNRVSFRATGVFVIVLSTALPLLTIPDYGAKKAVISGVGVAIAVLTGLRNFFQWDQLWSLLRQSDFELSYLLDKWKLDSAACDAATPEDRSKQLCAITQTLRDASEQVRRSESTRYFGSLRFPSTSGG